MAPSLCGHVIRSRRGLLAMGWSLVTLLTVLAFIVALTYSLSARRMAYDQVNNNYNYNQQNNNNEDDGAVHIAVTSRAMAFASLWTATLATLLSIYGTVVLGWQSPTGQYYQCCAQQVHRTSSLTVGAFIGSLLMFANLTLVCSVLFGEFEIRDYVRDGEDDDREDGGREGRAAQERVVQHSSLAFSILCIFLTVLYAGFAAAVFVYSKSLLAEHFEDERQEQLRRSTNAENSPPQQPTDGFIMGGGDRFDVMQRTGRHPHGFVKPSQGGNAAFA